MSSIEIGKVRLGKQDYKHDVRTLALAPFIAVPYFPPVWVFDAGRAAFPNDLWGNDAYGDCVVASRANAQLRLERMEQRRTIPIAANDVIELYKKMTGCKEPEDENDTGLVMLDAMRQWRKEGWSMAANKARVYKIAAFGEVDPMNNQELRAATYLLGGVHYGFSLPRVAQSMIENKVWDYNGETGPEWQPGSWGGHAVYGFGYDNQAHVIKTWGMNVRVTNAFMRKYCDEAWAVVDSFDSWRTKQTIDVVKLVEKLRSVASHVAYDG